MQNGAKKQVFKLLHTVYTRYYLKIRHAKYSYMYSHMNKCSVIQTLRNFWFLTTFLVSFLENPY